MSEITHNNYLKVGYNNNSFTLRNNTNDQFFVQYTPVTRDPFSFKDECIYTAKLLREKTDKTIYLMYSGGIDSEIVLRSFILAKIPNWKVFVMNYDNVNDYDLRYSKKFLSDNNINFHEHFFDLKKYWESDVIEDMKRYGSISPQFATYANRMFYIASELNGFPVNCCGNKNLYHDGNDLLTIEHEKGSTLYRVLLVNNIQGCGRFYQYTPELTASWYLSPHFKRLIIDNPKMILNQHGSSTFKQEFYSSNFNDESFNLVARRKKTGFENLSTLDENLRLEMKKFHYVIGNETQKIPFKTVCEQLGIQSLLRRP